MDDEDFSLTNGNTEDELSLPKATVTKLVQESLPSDIVVSKESLGLIIECCVEFIQLVASESNDICEGETKKTIVPEHIQTALANLGFTDYLKDVDTVIQELKQHAKTKEKKVNKFENSGLTVEELQKQQEELFEKAKQRYQTQQNSFESISSPIDSLSVNSSTKNSNGK